MGIILILGPKVRAGRRMINLTNGGVEISYEPLRYEGTDPGAYNTPGGITKHDMRRVTVVVQVDTDPHPQCNLVSFNGKVQILKESGR